MSERDRTESDRWLRQAEADLVSAGVLMDGGRFYMACFAAQQAAEKALKAFLYRRGAAAVYAHSVARLCRECAAHDPVFEHLWARAKGLDHYYIEARYPNGLPEQVPAEFFDRTDGEDAVSRAKAVLDLVREKMG